MTSSNIFAPRLAADVAALVDDYPLAWVVSGDPARRFATVLPLLVERDLEGAPVALFGHFARANPQVAVLEKDGAATVLVQGPNGYVPARLVSTPRWGPTWNYAVARFDVDVRFVPEETIASVERLAAALEREQADPWTIDRMGPRLEELARRIVAFRATIVRTHARFKLGQDEAPATFDEIVAGLDDAALAGWMTRTVRG